MGVTRRPPWWATWLLVAGLLSIFFGERVLGSASAGRAVLSLAGAAIVVVSAVWRGLAWRAATGDVRRVEGMLFLACAGCALALLGYLVSSPDGMRWLGIEFADPLTAARFATGLQVLWPIVLAASTLPALGAQIAIADHRHAPDGAPGVESFRIREIATAGLTIALAGSFLFVLGYLTSERDRTLDLSYFRTSEPGTATENLVAGLDAPLRVLFFFPAVNPVKDEITRYFRRLDARTGGVSIEEYDRLASPRMAAAYSVVEDGVIVLAAGDYSEAILIGATMQSARPRLRRLDQAVQSALMPLIRDERIVYFTTGHGELNDPGSMPAYAGTQLGHVDALLDLLGYLNYDVQELGLTTGLASDVPDDAAMVLVLGPQRPFLDAELATLERYAARGGALLFALDPDSDFKLGPLESTLGLRYTPIPLADDQFHVRQRGDLSDRRLLITDQFSSHEVMTSVNRAGPGSGLLLVSPGYIEMIEGASPSPSILVRSAPSAFDDLDRDYRFTEGSERRRNYEVVAAVQAPALDNSNASEPRMRALVFASSLMFSDGVITTLGLNAALVADAIRWLGGEEAFAGSTESEEDIPIMHTRAQDVAWFYAMIFGVPGLVLAAGLLGVHRYRRRGRNE